MRIVIAGCGSIASVHAECIHNMKEHQLAAFVDPKMERAEQFADKYGGKAYASMAEFFDKDRADALHICTPHYLHAKMAEEALFLGMHVFVEKPAVIHASQWNALTKISGNGRIGYCFQNRFHPSVLKILEILESGAAGRILGARAYLTWSRDAAYYLESDWRGRLSLEGGGAFINQSIHTLDLMDYMIGKQAVSIDAVTANHHLQGIIETEDAMSAYIVYPDMKASFSCSTAFVENLPPMIELYCENVWIRMEDMEVTCFYNDRKETVILEDDIKYGRQWWGSSHGKCIKEFYSCILENRKFRNDMDGVRGITALMLGAYASSRLGQTVKIQQMLSEMEGEAGYAGAL